jgi:ABC-2 type transport system ATP-binding protein
MAMIETHDLRKSYKSGKTTVEAVRGVNLQVNDGEIFGFLGPNGAGKTTTLRMLTTLLPPTSGEAMVAGYDLRREPKNVRRRIGYVSQVGGVDRHATGRENLVLQAQLYGLSTSEAKERTEILLKTLELDGFADRIASTYSGGQKRRLDLALGLVHQPRLVFLDEPTTGLDPQSRARLWDEVRRLRDEGTTVFLTTHYLEEADELCDRLAIIDDGQIVTEGTPEELKRRIAGDVVMIGLATENGAVHHAESLLRRQSFVRELEEGGEGTLKLYVERGEQALPQIMRTLDGAGLGLTSISLARPSLDDVFLRQTGRSLRDADG